MPIRTPALPAVLLTTTLTACGTSSPAPHTGPSGPGPTLEHVHGLGVNPADGVLHAASHHGVFRIEEDGTVTQVADRWQDTMAFTVTGPDTFLASGHADLREDLPPHLGLIESTDAAATWDPVALEGEADFHALEVAGDNTFGFDALSGRLLFSSDRQRWVVLAEAPIFDLAWPGDDEETVLASTQQGLVEYDVDTTATELAGEPPVVLIDSPRPGEIVGVTASGELYSSRDPDAGTWRQSPSTVPGTPQAIETTADTWYVATDRGVFGSGDRGRTWDALVSGPPQDE